MPANGEVHSAQQRLKKCIRQQAGSYGCVQDAGFDICGAKCRSALAREREVHSALQRLKKCIRQQAGSYGCVQSAGLVFTGPRVGARLPANGEVHSAQQRLKRCIRQQAGSYGCVQPAGLTFTGARRRGALAHERGSALSGVHRQLLLNEIQKALNSQRQL